MKKLILAIISAMLIVTQTTSCVIRYKLPDSENSSESSDSDIPVINLNISRTIDDYIIKNIDEDGVEIVRYIGEEADISVPAKLDGFPVISVGEAAFADLRYAQSITVPDGVEIICDDAFSNCRELTAIELPDSVTRLGKRAFAECVKLKSFRVPEKITAIEAYTFYNCYVIKEITLPNGLTHIGQGAFFNCAKLTEVTLPESLKTIEAEGFYSCFGLTEIKLPDSLEYLGKRTFDNCYNLEEILFKGEIYNVNLDDEHYDHSELLLAVNGEPEEEEDE